MERNYAVVLSCLLLVSPVLFAGDLEPSAAPGSTMKTLDEVEPRIPIPGSDTATAAFTISQSGSYYLAGNRLCNNTGISVTASDVTIDLMGYTLKGSGADVGILLGGCSNVEIKNGTVKNFQNGIYNSYNITGAENHRVINTRVVSNSRLGIYLAGEGNLVKSCTVSNNGGSPSATVYGIYVGGSSTISGNEISYNGQGSPYTVNCISCDGQSIICDNVILHNGDDCTGSFVDLITCSGGTINNNVCYNNAGSAVVNSVIGISAGFGSAITNNKIQALGRDADTTSVYGINASYGCTLTGNTVFQAGGSADYTNAYGIYASSGCSLMSNCVMSNGTAAGGTTYGIFLYGNDVAEQNVSYNNYGTNMYVGAGSVLGNNVAP